MSIDYTHFTPWASLVGGLLIGLSATIYILGLGRIAGIVGSALPGTPLAAGLLVGVGVRMGNGCTSGHGVCGLSRFSPRSLANVLAFMGAGVVAVYVVKHLL